MAPPVSLVLTVHNAAAGLQSRMEELLELVAELSPDFEVLIVDDGSTDGTEEVAHEVARAYPQMCVMRHAAHQGPLAAADTGMRHARGEIVFLQDYRQPTRSNDLRRLWRLRDRHDLLIARGPAEDDPPGPSLMDRLRAAATETPPYVPLGLQMVRRTAADQWREEFCPPAEPLGDVRRADSADAQPGPKFMTRIREFALGE